MVLLSLGTAMHGQSDSSFTNRLILKVAPLSLIDFYSGSSYKFGFEIKPISQLSITGDFGGYFRNFNVWKNYSGYNIDLGVRYYLKKNSLNERYYLGVNYFYKNQGFDYHDTIQSNIEYYTDYRTQKEVTCANVNFGWLKNYRQRLVIDLFAGIGMRYKKVDSTLTIEELEKGKEYADSQSLYFLVTPGKFIYPNINVGMRIGLRIL